MANVDKYQAENWPDFIEDYPVLTNREIAEKYQLTNDQLRYMANKFGVKKTEDAKAKAMNKRVFTQEEIAFIEANWEIMTNPQLAKALNIGLTSLRNWLYQEGLLKMELEYWTDEQTEFLKDLYRYYGDVEMAEMFEDRWFKQKGWTCKHIRKKRVYLNLHRTKEEIAAIKQRNVDEGRFLQCAIKRWATTGQAPEGEIRYWRQQSGRYIPRIKVDGGFIHYARYRYEQLHGPVPDGMCVAFLDDDPSNISDDNLGLLSREDISRRNAAKSIGALSDNYVAGVLTPNDPELRETIKRDHPELIALKRTQLLLNRQINESI